MAHLVFSRIMFVLAFPRSLQSKDIQRQPFGVTMCEQLCYNIDGCSSFLYEPTELVCHLISNDSIENVLNSQCHGFTHKKRSVLIVARMKCAVSSRKKFNRTKALVCIEPLMTRKCPDPLMLRKMSPTSPEPQMPRNIPHILVAGEGMGYSKLSFRQFQPQDTKTKPWTYRNEDLVGAIAYVESQKKIIFSRTVYWKVLSMAMDGSEITVLASNTVCHDIAVDNVHNLIFLSNHKSVDRMRTDGQGKVSIIKKHKTLFKSVVVDPNSKTLFVTDKKNIYSADYDGKYLLVRHVGPRTSALALDIKNDILYYNDKNSVIKLRLATNKVKTIKSFTEMPTGILLFGGDLYITLLKKSNIYVMSKNKEMRLVKNNYNEPVQQLKICLIP